MATVDVNVPVALTMLMSDWPEEPVDVNFFHARSFGDYANLFELTAEFYHKKLTRYVAVNGGDGRHRNGYTSGEAWPGAEYWFNELIRLGVKQKDVYRTLAALNTKQENDGFLDVARENNWRSAVISGCQPHQILRAFLGCLKSMADKDYWMRLYAAVPKQKFMSFWLLKVYSFSAMYTPEELPPPDERWRMRFDLMPGEFLKISEYQAKGHLATFEELFTYLKQRHLIV